MSTIVRDTTDTTRAELARLLRWARQTYAFRAIRSLDAWDYAWYPAPLTGREGAVVYLARQRDGDFLVWLPAGEWRCRSIDEALTFLRFAGVVPAEAVTS